MTRRSIVFTELNRVPKSGKGPLNGRGVEYMWSMEISRFLTNNNNYN